MTPAPSSTPAHGTARIYQVLIIALATLFIYAPAFHGSWLWDDDSEVTAHTALRSVGGLGNIWAAQSSVDYLPVKSTVQWIYYRFAGENLAWWHLLNVALHVLGALLVWRLVEKLGARHAWIAGLLYGIHPVAVGSVAWISELKNTLSLPLLILTMLAYIRYDERGRKSDLLLACGLFLATMFTKASAVMFPFVILLYAWWKHAGTPPSLPPPVVQGGWMRRAVLSGIPFFLISLGAGLSTLYFQQIRAIGPEAIPLGGALSRIALSGTAAWFYLYKSLMPFRLLPNYPRWHVDPPTVLQLLAWPAMFALLFFCWTKRRTWGRHALLGLGFFLLNLVPILGFVRISYMRITWAADHFAYIPLVGTVGLVAAAAGALYDSSDELQRAWLRGGALVILAVFTIESHRYSEVFTGEESMWTYTLKRNPDAWQAHSRLSSVMLARGNFGAAFFHAGEAHRLRPDLPETYNNYANVLAAKGELRAAVDKQRRAVEMAPYSEFFRMNLANLLVRNQEQGEAARIYKELLEKHPNEPMFLCNYGAALFFEGRVDESIPYFEKAVDLNPNLGFAQANLAAARHAKAGPMPLQGSIQSGSLQGVQFLNSDSPLRLFAP